MIYWNKRAAKHGHGAARVKLARAYLKKLPSALEQNPEKAFKLYRNAVRDSQDANAHYGLAELHLAHLGGALGHVKTAEAAVERIRQIMPTVMRHLEGAAYGGNPYAMFNLGLAHLYGYYDYGRVRDPELAGEWFAASGLPEGYHAKGMHLRSKGSIAEAEEFERRALALGYGSAMRKMARERTGLGGASGIDLNLQWPPLMDGQTRPPLW